jgi:hypothetical protein
MLIVGQRVGVGGGGADCGAPTRLYCATTVDSRAVGVLCLCARWGRHGLPATQKARVVGR